MAPPAVNQYFVFWQMFRLVKAFRRSVKTMAVCREVFCPMRGDGSGSRHPLRRAGILLCEAHSGWFNGEVLVHLMCFVCMTEYLSFALPIGGFRRFCDRRRHERLPIRPICFIPFISGGIERNASDAPSKPRLEGRSLWMKQKENSIHGIRLFGFGYG